MSTAPPKSIGESLVLAADPRPTSLTASGIEREFACLGSSTLPKLRHHNPYAGGGSRLHLYTDLAVEVGKEKAAELVVQELPEEHRGREVEFLIAVDLDGIPAGCDREVGLALNIKTGEAIRIDGREKGYPNLDPRAWVLGTADRLGMRGPSRVFVADLKRYMFRARADQCAQIDFYALAATRLPNVNADDADTMLMRPVATGWITDRAYRDSLALEAFFDELEQHMEARDRARRVYLAGGPMALLDRGMLSTGPQCELCDSARHCPALRHDVERFAGVDPSALLAILPPKVSEREAVDRFHMHFRGVMSAREDEALELYREADGLRARGDEAGALALEERAALSLETIGKAFTMARLIRMAAAGALKAADEIAARTPLPLANGLWRYQGHTTRWVKSETADTELAEKMDDLRARGEITQRTVEQMRTGKRPRGK